MSAAIWILAPESLHHLYENSDGSPAAAKWPCETMKAEDTRRMGRYGSADDTSRCIITQRQCLFKSRNVAGRFQLYVQKYVNCHCFRIHHRKFARSSSATLPKRSAAFCWALSVRVRVDEFGNEMFFPGWMKRWSIFLTLNWSLFGIEHHDCDHCIWYIHNKEYW